MTDLIDFFKNYENVALHIYANVITKLDVNLKMNYTNKFEGMFDWKY